MTRVELRRRSGMVRLHRWQLSWSYRGPGGSYCYLSDRRLRRVHWLVGGGS